MIMFLMYVLWIWYICANIWTYAHYQTWLPSEITLCTAACFIVETVSLARIRMAKEGYLIPTRKPNTFLSKVGLNYESELEEEAQRISAENEKKESQDESGQVQEP